MNHRANISTYTFAHASKLEYCHKATLVRAARRGSPINTANVFIVETDASEYAYGEKAVDGH